MSVVSNLLLRVVGVLPMATIFSLSVAAQTPAERQFVEAAGGGLWVSIFFIIVLTLGGGWFIWWRLQRPDESSLAGSSNNRIIAYYDNGSYEMDGLDLDREMEWLRKAKGTKRKRSVAPDAAPAVKTAAPAISTPHTNLDIDTKAFQERMRRMQYSQLPINSFTILTPARSYEPLPVSSDLALVNAIEQANEEYEEDESVRELALKILSAFKTRNSIEALSQIALYDLSSNLRSKAVTALTEFDHPSVFESILLACADPTREVRAAAARGLFRLSFDRADAWKRIMESNDEFRMRQAARAAIESSFVTKSFDRLVHEDMKISYEAFSLVCLMIAAGEAEPILNAIRSHRDERVKFALLHVLKVRRDMRTFNELQSIERTAKMSDEVLERLRDAIGSFQKVAV